MNSQVVTIYRALSGPALDNGGRLWSGVTDKQLENEGIFFSNESVQQSRGMLMFLTSLDFEMRMVPGLPVFLTQTAAQSWAEHYQYQQKARPAIAIATLPLEILSGETATIRIIRNTAVESQDFPVTEKMLRRHLSGEEQVEGERFLQGDLKTLRNHETFLRPVEMKKCSVNIKRGWQNIGSLIEGGMKSVEGL